MAEPLPPSIPQDPPTPGNGQRRCWHTFRLWRRVLSRNGLLQRIGRNAVWFWETILVKLIALLENETLILRLIGIGVVAAGWLLLIGSLVLPWFVVPIGLTESEPERFVVQTQEGSLTPILRTFVASLAFYMAQSLVAAIRNPVPEQLWRWQISVSKWSLTIGVLALLYPALTVNLDTRLAAHASWLQDQHLNLTWLGGDVYNNAEGKDDITKSGMIFASNPLQTGIYPLPDDRGGNLQVSSIALILEWFGYGIGFTQFDEKGWVMALLGCGTVVLGNFRLGMVAARSRRVLRQVFKLPFVVGVAGLFLVITPITICGHHLEQARLEYARGRYEPSLRHLELAAMWLPAARQHSQYVAQKGYLLLALNRFTEPEAQLVQGIELEMRGRLAEAEAVYWDLVHHDRDQAPWTWSPTTRDAYRSLIRAGIEDLNSGQTDGAVAIFSELLAICPDNLKCAVALQFGSLQHGNPARCERLANAISEIYSVFDAIEKRTVLSAVFDNTARAYFVQKDGDKTAEFYRRALRGK